MLVIDLSRSWLTLILPHSPLADGKYSTKRPLHIQSTLENLAHDEQVVVSDILASVSLQEREGVTSVGEPDTGRDAHSVDSSDDEEDGQSPASSSASAHHGNGSSSRPTTATEEDNQQQSADDAPTPEEQSDAAGEADTTIDSQSSGTYREQDDEMDGESFESAMLDDVDLDDLASGSIYLPADSPSLGQTALSLPLGDAAASPFSLASPSSYTSLESLLVSPSNSSAWNSPYPRSPGPIISRKTSTSFPLPATPPDSSSLASPTNCHRPGSSTSMPASATFSSSPGSSSSSSSNCKPASEVHEKRSSWLSSGLSDEYVYV